MKLLGRVLILLPVSLLGEIDSYSENPDFLNVKELFAQREIQAIAEPFVGVHSSQGIETGLFPLRSTGVSTEPVVRAAQAFLAALRPEQEVKTVFAVNDPEWRRWCNVDNGIYVRQGLSLKEMTPGQREAAMNLMRASLSARGLALTEGIRKTDQTLREINEDVLAYDEDLYFFTLMGLPSETEPWGWQVDGHHLVINYFVLGDQVVMTPAFLGGEPIHTRSGKYQGNVLLQDEQDTGLEFYRMLDSAQRAKATRGTRKNRSDNRAEAFQDNLVLDYEGVPARDLTAAQQAALVRLIGLYAGNLREEHARIWLDEVVRHLDDTWFLWIGEASDTGKFYYRIHSPVILIEFDHQLPVGTVKLNPPGVPTREHIHIVVRTPNGNDYGKDLLRQHLEQHAH